MGGREPPRAQPPVSTNVTNTCHGVRRFVLVLAQPTPLANARTGQNQNPRPRTNHIVGRGQRMLKRLRPSAHPPARLGETPAPTSKDKNNVRVRTLTIEILSMLVGVSRWEYRHNMFCTTNALSKLQ